MTWEQLDLVSALWIVFAVYWLVAAFATSRNQKRESFLSSLPRNMLLAIAGLLVFDPALNKVRWLGTRFAAPSPELRAVGIAITAAGLALAFWARYHLGRNWSGQITLKEDHHLVCSGPYRYLRHPIYSGILVGMLGTALAVGRYRALLGLVIAVAGFMWKAHQEDVWLARAFGEEFERHRRRTGALVPRIRQKRQLQVHSDVK
jgi:protein-S-isoprenylcysteine O-methyltransferase Ste14